MFGVVNRQQPLHTDVCMSVTIKNVVHIFPHYPRNNEIYNNSCNFKSFDDYNFFPFYSENSFQRCPTLFTSLFHRKFLAKNL